MEFLGLPQEIILLCFDYVEGIQSLRLTCKRFKSLVERRFNIQRIEGYIDEEINIDIAIARDDVEMVKIISERHDSNSFGKEYLIAIFQNSTNCIKYFESLSIKPLLWLDEDYSVPFRTFFDPEGRYAITEKKVVWARNYLNSKGFELHYRSKSPRYIQYFFVKEDKQELEKFVDRCLSDKNTLKWLIGKSPEVDALISKKLPNFRDYLIESSFCWKPEIINKSPNDERRPVLRTILDSKESGVEKVLKIQILYPLEYLSILDLTVLHNDLELIININNREFILKRINAWSYEKVTKLSSISFDADFYTKLLSKICKAADPQFLDLLLTLRKISYPNVEEITRIVSECYFARNELYDRDCFKFLTVLAKHKMPGLIDILLKSEYPNPRYIMIYWVYLHGAEIPDWVKDEAKSILSMKSELEKLEITSYDGSPLTYMRLRVNAKYSYCDFMKIFNKQQYSFHCRKHLGLPKKGKLTKARVDEARISSIEMRRYYRQDLIGMDDIEDNEDIEEYYRHLLEHDLD